MNMRMRVLHSLLPLTLLATAALVVSAAKRPSGSSSYGSSPSSSSSASKPSAPSVASPNSSPSFGRPSTGGGGGRPNAFPTSPTRPSFRSPGGPMSPTSRNAYNPNPSYKPMSPTGAPTVRSGGGGYGTLAKKVFVAAAVGTATMIAVQVAAGYFLYGGRHSSPYCRGDEADRFASGHCPRGTSTQAHQCPTNIPLCPIPEVVRSKWNVGADAPPQVEVRFDKSFCSVATTSATTSANATGNATATSAAVDGVEGQSGLGDCVRRIVAAGGCATHNPASQFFYDEDAGTCGCCSGVQVTTLDTFSAAVYAYKPADDLTAAPTHCISGSKMFYSAVGLEEDQLHACECGACTNCGGGAPRYLDWSGPFAVPDGVGATTFADAAETVPAYDPVDTCLCDDASRGTCDADFAGGPELRSGAIPGQSGGGRALGLLSGLLLWHLIGRN